MAREPFSASNQRESPPICGGQRCFLPPKADRQLTKSDSLNGILAGSQSLTDIETLFEFWL